MLKHIEVRVRENRAACGLPRGTIQMFIVRRRCDAQRRKNVQYVALSSPRCTRPFVGSAGETGLHEAALPPAAHVNKPAHTLEEIIFCRSAYQTVEY